MKIKNPWNHNGSPVGEFYRVPEKPIHAADGVSFYKLPSSVLAVSADGFALTECVTVAGAKRVLASRKLAEEAKERKTA